LPPTDDQQHAERHDDYIAVLQDEIGDVERRKRYAVGHEVEETHDHEQGEQQPVIAQAVLPEARPRAGRRRRAGGLDRYVFIAPPHIVS